MSRFVTLAGPFLLLFFATPALAADGLQADSTFWLFSLLAVIALALVAQIDYRQQGRRQRHLPSRDRHFSRSGR